MHRNSSCYLLKKSKCVGRSLAFCIVSSDASDFPLLLASVKKRPRTKPCTFLRLVRGLRPSEKGFSDKADGVLIKLRLCRNRLSLVFSEKQKKIKSLCIEIGNRTQKNAD